MKSPNMPDNIANTVDLLRKGKSNLTSLQQRQYFLSKLSSDYRCSYIETLQINGECDLDELQQALVDFTRTVPILNSQYKDFEGNPYMFHNNVNDANIIILDEKSFPEISPNNRLQKSLYLENQYRFDLENSCLYRILILTDKNKPIYIILNFSKLIFDRMSVLSICEGISNLYTSYSNYLNKFDFKKSLNSIEREWANSAEALKAKKYWNNAVSNISKITLDAESNKKTQKSHNYLSETKNIGLQSIIKYTTEHNIDLRSLILAAFSIVLYRYSGAKKFCIGTSLERRDKNIVMQLGPLNEALPLSFNVNSDEIINKYIKKCEQNLIEAKKNSRYPFKRIISEINSGQDVSSTPIFQVEYEHTNLVKHTFSLRDTATICLVPTPLNYSETDLSLLTYSTENELQMYLHYNIDSISSEFSTNMLNSLQVLLKDITHNYCAKICDLSIFPKRLLDNIRSCSNGPYFHYNKNILLHTLFEKSVENHSTALAVQSGKKTLTYEKLNSESNRLAHYILELKLSKSSNILVMLTRTINYAISVLGVLKAGHTFVPIDDHCPKERIDYIIHDASISLIITESVLLKNIPGKAVQHFCIDAQWGRLSKLRTENPNLNLNHDNLAYMIYTSGTTGKPKAVMISHEAIVNNIMFRQNKWPLMSHDRVLFNTSFNFDPSIWSLFWPISTGAASIITPNIAQTDLRELSKFITANDISIIGTVPSIIQYLFDQPNIANFSNLRLILSGGEILTNKVCDLVTSKSKAILVNLYGPTETTIDATFYQIDPNNIPKVIPIGKPIHNMSAFILNSDLNIVPNGVIGELYIGGLGLSSGYYGQSQLTREKFINNPVKHDGTVLYTTGDLVYRDKNNNLHYIGRKDDQVKINGFRIEISEIEKVSRSHPKITDSAVIILNNRDYKSICLCLNSIKSAQIDISDVKNYLSEWLPDYMIPHRVIFMDEFPKTINGKVDKIKIKRFIEKSKKDKIVSKPTNDIEKKVLNDFCNVLDVKNIGIHDNFFDLGGTSLQLSKLASNLFNRFSLELPLHAFFKMPTVAGISSVISEIQSSSVSEYLAQQHFQQLRTDIYLDSDIKPDGLPSADFKNPNAIFLTGATGYLGSFILENLLNKTTANIYCLVRAKSSAHAYERITQSLKEYRIDIKNAGNRILPILGDLSKPQLGIKDPDWLHLSEVIDVVYHNGAMVNFVYPYSALRAANVESVRILLRLCSLKKLKALHYVSSIDSLLSVHAPRPFLEEPSLLPLSGDIPGGYTGSKLVGENVANLARQIGMPVSIYRPGLIMSHSKTGATHTIDYLLVAFRGFLPFKILPDYPRIFDIVPVDYVAEALVHISLQDNNLGKFYHLFNPQPGTINEFCSWIKDFGYEFDIVSFSTAREIALQVEEGHPLYPLLPLIRDADPTPQRSLDPLYLSEVTPDIDCRNTLNLLSGSGINCPPVSRELAHKCLEYLVDIKFLPTPGKTTRSTNV